MTLRFQPTLLCMSLMALLIPPVLAFDAVVGQMKIHTAINAAIVPAVVAFEENADQLQETLALGCHGEQVHDAFVQTVISFSGIEYLRLGPLNQENRAERLFFWPDRKGIAERQLRRLLAMADIATVDSTTLAGKSVAVQGLAALERILFDSTPPTDNACLLGQSIAGNIARIANEVSADWTSKNGIARLLTNPKRTSTYRTPEESLAALLTLATNAIENISERKLDLVISGLQNDGTIPRTAPFFKSDQTLANIRNNITSVERLLIDSGIAGAAGKQAANQLRFESKTSYSMLDAAEDALAINDNETAIQRLQAVQNILTNSQDVVKDTIAKYYRVSTGFNASDGD